MPGCVPHAPPHPPWQLEVGGVARLPDGKWYAHACAIAWGHVSGLGGCFNVEALAPGGPYTRAEKNWALIAYPAQAPPPPSPSVPPAVS